MEDTPKKVLVTICSRNPNFDYLSQNIDYFNNLLQGYQFCICIVDSDSDEEDSELGEEMYSYTSDEN